MYVVKIGIKFISLFEFICFIIGHFGACVANGLLQFFLHLFMYFWQLWAETVIVFSCKNSARHSRCNNTVFHSHSGMTIGCHYPHFPFSRCCLSHTHVCIFTYWFGQGAVTKSCSCISVDKLRYVFRAFWCHRLDRERSQWSARRRHALSAWHFYSLSEVTVTNEHVCFRERRFLFIITLRSRKVRWCRLWQLEKISGKKGIMRIAHRD